VSSSSSSSTTTTTRSPGPGHASPPDGARPSDRPFYIANALVSTAALAFLTWILVIGTGAKAEADLSFLPAVNAGLNSLAAVLLTAGWVAIRRKAVKTHRTLMVSAFAASSAFLVSYLVYHYFEGDTRYPADAPLRGLYLFILASHVLLSVGIVPMALSAFWFAFRRRFATHKRVTRILLPVWLYVSVTGVVIFFMLRSATAGA
jgi:putative membrane protein